VRAPTTLGYIDMATRLIITGKPERIMTRVSRAIVVVLLSGVYVWAGSFAGSQAQQRDPGTATIDPNHIGGVVTSSKGPEAGVWVIAEATTLPTRFRKIVVTDDRGRYVVPDLPRGTYSGDILQVRVPAHPERSLD
jgi:hypothetical protein